MELSVVIPAYNESKRIIKTIDQVLLFFTQENITGELIVVNDASTDDTFEQLSKYSSTQLTIIDFQKNQGKGAAVKAGILATKFQHILFMDADSATEIGEIKKFFPYFDNQTILIGSRHHSDSLINKKQPISRVFGGWLGRNLIRIFLGLNFMDTQCGFKCLPASAKPIISKLTINRFGFDFELLYLAKKYNLPVKEIGIHWTDQANSTVKFKDYFRTLKELLVIKKNDKEGKYEDSSD